MKNRYLSEGDITFGVPATCGGSGSFSGRSLLFIALAALASPRQRSSVQPLALSHAQEQPRAHAPRPTMAHIHPQRTLSTLLSALAQAGNGIGNASMSPNWRQSRNWRQTLDAFYPHGGTLSLFPGKTAHFNLAVSPNWRQNHPLASIISLRIDRISSIANLSRLINSFSSSFSAVAFTEMSANLAGNRIEVSSQLKAE